MEGLSKDQKISYVTAISTLLLWFVAFIALIFTMLQFIKSKFLGYRTVFLILVVLFLSSIVIILLTKRWIQK